MYRLIVPTFLLRRVQLSRQRHADKLSTRREKSSDYLPACTWTDEDFVRLFVYRGFSRISVTRKA